MREPSAQAADQRQLEDEPRSLRGDPGRPEAVVPARRARTSRWSDVSIHPPFTDLRSVQVTLADQKATEIALGAQTCHWEDKGAFTGEVSPAFLAKLDVAVRDRRALRAPRAVRRDRRRREPQGQGDPPPRDDADHVCRRDARGARGGRAPKPRWSGQVEAGLAGLKADQVAALVHRLRADLGHRHRPHRHAGRRASRLRARCGRPWPALSTPETRRIGAGSSTAGRSRRRTSPT